MIRKAEECRVELKEHMRDGDGTVELTHFRRRDDSLDGQADILGHP